MQHATSRGQGDMYVHVGFRVPDDLAYSSAVRRLDLLMADRFGEEQERRRAEPGEGEVIYRIQRPLLAGSGEIREFFESLRSVFNETSAYMPYFAQGQGVAG